MLHIRDVTGKEIEDALLRELDRQSHVDLFPHPCSVSSPRRRKKEEKSAAAGLRAEGADSFSGDSSGCRGASDDSNGKSNCPGERRKSNNEMGQIQARSGRPDCGFSSSGPEGSYEWYDGPQPTGG